MQTPPSPSKRKTGRYEIEQKTMLKNGFETQKIENLIERYFIKWMNANESPLSLKLI